MVEVSWDILFESEHVLQVLSLCVCCENENCELEEFVEGSFVNGLY